MGETGVSGLIVGDVKGTEEEKKKDHHPPHLTSPPNFSAVVEPMIPSVDKRVGDR